MGGGPSQVTQTTQNQLPPWLQPWSQNYLNIAGATATPGLAAAMPEAQSWIGGNAFGPYPFPYQQVAPLTGPQQQGIAGVQAQGAVSPLNTQAQGYLSSTMGTNATRNPYLDDYYKMASKMFTRQYEQSTVPTLAARGLQAGAFGGSGYKEAFDTNQAMLGESLTNLATQIYTPAWQTEEQLRQDAARMVPGMVQAGYMPAQMLMAAGGTEQAQAQKVLDTGYQNLQGQAQFPFQMLQMLAEAIKNAMAGQGGGIETKLLPTKGPFGPSF